VRIAVIGYRGRMGRWFTNYFLSQGHSVVLYDRRRGEMQRGNEKNVTVAKTLREAVSTSELVFVSVSLSSMKQVLHECEKILRSGGNLVEITSLKLFIVKDLERLSSKGVTVVSVHPMFGPSTRSVDGKLLIHIPVREASKEAELARRLVPGAELRSMPAKAHDQVMAYVLGLPYILNTIFIASLRGKNLADLAGLAGSTFPSHLALAERVTESTGNIIPDILVLNPYSKQILRKAEEAFRIVSRSIDEGDPEPIRKLLSDFLRAGRPKTA